MDARHLIETLKTHGVELRIHGDMIRAEAPHEPDPHTKALLDEVRERRKEVRRLLASNDLKNGRDERKSKFEEFDDLPTKGWTREPLEVREGETILGVKIATTVLNDDIWLILDRSFIPSNELACYYPEEIPLLKGKSLEDLREIHKVKLAFLGCRVIQEGLEKQCE